jgi:exodeoxyribonuclease VII large subunit
MPDEYWIEAELSEVHVNKGHCYVEFVENEVRTGRAVAKARGIIWQQNFVLLKSYFEDTTGQEFAAGIKVRVKVGINFHEVFGYSLIVYEIDPAYTLGDMALRRQQILRKLEEEGIIQLNKELHLPEVPQRIAVISSKTAAGYGDFCNQLAHNEQGFAFHVELFEALMQGNQVEQSILSAMQQIDLRVNEFDVLVIIRGGGATSDLSAFDNYLLAAAIAQFRLPVITGIGHERDETVIDKVANTHVKTPTAAATLLIDRMSEASEYLWSLALQLQNKVVARLNVETQRLLKYRSSIPALVMHRLNENNSELTSYTKDLQAAADKYLLSQKHRLSLYATKLRDASPQKILSKGYSITMQKGKVLKSAQQCCENNIIETQLYRGTIRSKIIKEQQ